MVQLELKIEDGVFQREDSLNNLAHDNQIFEELQSAVKDEGIEIMWVKHMITKIFRHDKDLTTELMKQLVQSNTKPVTCVLNFDHSVFYEVGPERTLICKTAYRFS